MLKSLFIKNYAIIEQLELEWFQGLSAITGETGAGKSIILGALNLALGARADSKAVGKWSDKCIVEICFLPKSEVLKQINDALNTDAADEIIIRREVHANGKSRNFLNDSPALVNEIQWAASKLVGIHQQFDQLDFLEKEKQAWILDCYANLLEERAQYKAEWKTYQNLLQEKSALINKKQSQLAEKDFLEFQLNEFNKLNLKKGETIQLEQKIQALVKSEDIIHNTTMAFQILEREGGVIEQLQTILSGLRNIQINKPLAELYNRIDQCKTELKDCLHELEHQAEAAQSDPAALANYTQRLDQINRMMAKHQLKSEEALFTYVESVTARLNEFESMDNAIASLEAKIDTQLNKLRTLENAVFAQRQRVIPELIKSTLTLLRRMGLEHARFDIYNDPPNQTTPSNLDGIEFLFAANKGAQLKPMKDQISGGELARFNLAIQSLTAQNNNIGTMVFDEIDTGVSGQIALEMGNILKETAKRIQVICITHSPQVASRAHQHYKVYKEHDKSNTITHIRLLSQGEKITELATMLSGTPPGKAAIDNALDLLSR